MNRFHQPLQRTLRNLIATCCCHGFFLCATFILCIQLSHASLEPVKNHLGAPALSKEHISAPLSNTAAKQNIQIAAPQIANPKLSLSTHMSSSTLPEAPVTAPVAERDELHIVARAQPSQNRSDLGAANANNSKEDVLAEVKAEDAKVEKIYKQENNYLLALALILLTAGLIAFALFFKWK